MSVSDDIGNLFRKFGGDAGAYQEVARDDEAQIARARWPLLATLDVEAHQSVPTVSVRTPGAAVQIKAAQPAANPARPASKLPLFARGHRHATTPVPAVAAPPRVVGAPRFAPAPKGEDTPQEARPAAPASAPAPAPVRHAADQTAIRAPVAPQDDLRPASPVAGMFGRAAAAHAPARVPAVPASVAPVAHEAPAAVANSILGQMFRAAPAPASAGPEVKGDLSRLFRRLENPRVSEPTPAPAAPASASILGRARFDVPRRPS
jgi:hypothetical protein